MNFYIEFLIDFNENLRLRNTYAPEGMKIIKKTLEIPKSDLAPCRYNSYIAGK